MPAVTLGVDDLNLFADEDIEVFKAQAMIDDVIALAARVAPCILEEDFAFAAAAKAILRGVVLRWNASGSNPVSQRQQGAGPFSVNEVYERPSRGGLFQPAEIEQLQDLCRDAGAASGAFVIDTLPDGRVLHADICSLNFGALYCSCGAVLAGTPLYEV